MCTYIIEANHIVKHLKIREVDLIWKQICTLMHSTFKVSLTGYGIFKVDRHFEHNNYSDNYTTNYFQDLHKKIKNSLDKNKFFFILATTTKNNTHIDLSMNRRLNGCCNETKPEQESNHKGQDKDQSHSKNHQQTLESLSKELLFLISPSELRHQLPPAMMILRRCTTGKQEIGREQSESKTLWKNRGMR